MHIRMNNTQLQSSGNSKSITLVNTNILFLNKHTYLQGVGKIKMFILKFDVNLESC